jgi:signal transduction histidine kinase
MSVAVPSPVARRPPQGSSTPDADPPQFVTRLQWAVTIPTVAILTTGLALAWSDVRRSALEMLPWLLLVIAAELLPVFYSDRVNLTLSMPLLLAAGMTFGPVPAGLLGFLGSWDRRLLRGEITWANAFFNRSQIALSSMAAAATFHALGGVVDRWPSVILPCAAAAAMDILINVTSVSVMSVFVHQKSWSRVAGGILLDHPFLFVATYLGLVPIALLMATAARLFGIAGLAAGVVPILMARQVFSLLKNSSIASREAQERQAVIEQLSSRIESERRDERARLAMDLHDGALAALFRVHLMGEVLRQDLMSGRLLELEADVPELREATAAATDTLRSLISGLRDSSVGAQGVCKTLDLLLDEMSSSTRARLHSDLGPISSSPSIQLVIYQIAREALENAVRHSDAQNIRLTLRSEGDWVRLLIRDDGTGFVRAHVDRQTHFGLDMMAQRAEGVGGLLHVASEPGWGTQVVARLPADPSSRD